MLRTKIDALTSEQEQRLTEFRDKWIAIGLNTGAADRERAERAINHCYELAGLPAPRKIVWCGSPLSQGLTRAIILNCRPENSVGNSVRASVWDSVRDSVWDSVGTSVRASVWASVWDSVRDSVGTSVWNSVGNSVWDSVRDSVWDSVGTSVRASVRASVWNSVGNSVWDSVRDSVWDSVGTSVRASVWDSVRDSVGTSVWNSVHGQHNAHWLGFYEFLRDVVGLTEQTEPAAGLIEQAKCAGWFLPHANICWVSERHNVLAHDDRGRLHSVAGPAVQYPDGWSIYAVHGVRVPSEIVEHPESITVRSIQEQENAEVRRVMIDQYGPSRYLQDSGAIPIHADEFGTLYRQQIPNDEPLVMVNVINATPEPDGSRKTYFIRVPPDMETARQAVAWTFNKTPETYQPIVET